MQTHPARAPINDSYLSADVLLMGGISIIVCLGCWAFMDVSAPVYTVASLAFALCFICNDPHFLASYTLLYGDYRKKILTDGRYFWVGVAVPVALILVLGVALFKASADLMAHAITAMYFLVGWHYVKQIFGCVIVTSVQRKIFYSKWQRNFLLFNLTATWFMSWLGSHVQPEGFDYYGVQHYSLDLPPWTMNVVYVAVALSLAAVIWMQYRHYIKTGQKPAPPAVAAFVSIYAWYLPFAYHPGFSYLIPFFHSLQYLAFVWQMKKNEVMAQIGNLEGPVYRSAWIRLFGGYMLRATILGILAFEVVPQFLDKQGLVTSTNLGPTPILAAALLFINIHHYFIDNVIWRSDNATVRTYLFQTSSVLTVQDETRKAV